MKRQPFFQQIQKKINPSAVKVRIFDPAPSKSSHPLASAVLPVPHCMPHSVWGGFEREISIVWFLRVGVGVPV